MNQKKKIIRKIFMISNLIEKTISSEYLFNGRVVNLRIDKVILPNGKEGTREIIEHNGGVAILPIIEGNKCLLIKQYRQAFKDIIIEIPAGKLEKKEEPLGAAHRELLEETGGIASDLVFLGKMYSSVGYTNEIIYLYVAKIKEIKAQKLDHDEFLEVIKMDINKAKEMVINNEIKDAKTALAILLYWGEKNARNNGEK